MNKLKIKMGNNGIKFTRTKLGEPVFVKINAKDAMHSIRPQEWSITQLRLIADYMEENNDCTLFPDGSGDLVKK